MRPKSLSRPGIYLVMGYLQSFVAEVAEDGSVHQLEPDTLSRDGELSEHGWDLSSVRAVHGPFKLKDPNEL